jgi:hypothetical protein
MYAATASCLDRYLTTIKLVRPFIFFFARGMKFLSFESEVSAHTTECVWRVDALVA